MNFVLCLTLNYMVLINVWQNESVQAMSNCETKNAICRFAVGLLGSIQFQQETGTDCKTVGKDAEMRIKIYIDGFSRREAITTHNIRLKEYAGGPSHCNGLGNDFGGQLSNLGNFHANGRQLFFSGSTGSGIFLDGEQSIIGRSVAVYSVPVNGDRHQTLSHQVEGCCIVGHTNGPQTTVASAPLTSTVTTISVARIASEYDNNNNNNEHLLSRPGINFNFEAFGNNPIRRHTLDEFPVEPKRKSFGGETGSFQQSSFRSPFNLDDNLFFDLSGKTSLVNSVLRGNVAANFKAPEAPRFQDIYGIETGKSPLSRSDYGNTVRPFKKSKMSRVFFNGKDNIKGLIEFGLTPEEMAIPKDYETEESSPSAQVEDKNEKYPYDDSDKSLPPEYGSTDISKASFLPYGVVPLDDGSTGSINIKKHFHNGKAVNVTTDDPEQK